VFSIYFCDAHIQDRGKNAHARDRYFGWRRKMRGEMELLLIPRRLSFLPAGQPTNQSPPPSPNPSASVSIIRRQILFPSTPHASSRPVDPFPALTRPGHRAASSSSLAEAVIPGSYAGLSLTMLVPTPARVWLMVTCARPAGIRVTCIWRVHCCTNCGSRTTLRRSCGVNLHESWWS
jgi:hypothetical protein